MIKKLTRHGDSMFIEIERPILELIGAAIDSEFDVVTDGSSLVLTPIKNMDRQAEFRKSMEKIGKRYAKSFEELAK